MRDIRRLVQQATDQQGLLTLPQAVELGVDRQGMGRLCRAGVFERVARGLFRLPGSVESWRHRLARVCFSTTPHAVASHRSALDLWGLRTTEQLEASVRYPRQLRRVGAVVHRSVDLVPADVTWVDGIPATTPVRTVCDAGLIFPIHEVRRLLDHSIAIGLVTVGDMWRFRRRVGRQGRNGVGAIHEALEDLPAGAALAESGPEVALLRICERFGLPEPAIQFPVVVGGRTFRADIAYPEARVLIEYDGFVVHTDPGQFVADRRRQNALNLEGWTVLRFTHRDLVDRPGSVAAEIERAIGASLSDP